MYEKTKKTEKRKMTSVLSFFLFCTRKHQNGKTKIDFRFIFFRFLYEKNTKNGKTTNDFLFIVFPFYRFSFYVLKQTKTYKRKLTSVLSFFFVSSTNQCKKRAGYNLIFRFYFFFRFLWLFKWTKSWDREGSRRGGGGGVWVGVGGSFRKLV